MLCLPLQKSFLLFNASPPPNKKSSSAGPDRVRYIDPTKAIWVSLNWIRSWPKACLSINLMRRYLGLANVDILFFFLTKTTNSFWFAMKSDFVVRWAVSLCRLLNWLKYKEKNCFCKIEFCITTTKSWYIFFIKIHFFKAIFATKY